MQDDNDSVKQALSKKGAYGADVDLTKYRDADSERIPVLNDVDDELRKGMESTGVVTDEKGRAGTIMFIGNEMSHCSSKQQEGVEILSLREAMKKHPWLKDYYWKAMDPAKDKYTAKTYLDESDGYFIHVKEGMHVRDPIQTCMMIRTDKSVQHLHNIIIVDKDASLEMITGCSTNHGANDALHIGVSEIYVKKNASLTFSMLHNWGTKTVVRPRTTCIVEKGGKYINNYVLLNPVGTLQSFPLCKLNGEGASCRYNTICLAHKESDIDTGGAVELNAPKTSAEILSRSINRGGKMTARGRLIGNCNGAKAHLECRSIVLADGGKTVAIPELESTVADVEMTHEAAVGKIARDQIEYLMSRGLSEDEAVGMIVRGFLVGGIRGLPDNLTKEIDDVLTKADLGN